MAEQDRAIAIAQQSKAQSEAQALADQARAKAVTEEERVFTARETEMANRKKQIDLIGASQQAERDALRIRVGAEAESSPRQTAEPRCGQKQKRGLTAIKFVRSRLRFATKWRPRVRA